ncbi:MAG TPA: efflux RND transporter permease subunit [Bryobacteraceae bacterium]|nr:efflux RND transporter permease subunit [Bryobacteraceae bacterium]
MNLSETCIRRPIATTLLMAGIALFGVVAYYALPVSDLPTVDFPSISVSASLPGADPNTMASAVATPLERQFTTIAGIDTMTSTSSLGSTQISLTFDLSRDIDGAAVDVQTAISAAMPLLPPGMPNPPSFRKSNPADSPIMHLTLTSPTLPLHMLDEYAQTTIAQRISQVPGVAQVGSMGSYKYSVHVQVSPHELASRGIGINEVANAIRGWNVNLPTGTLSGPHQSFSIQANGQLMNAAAYSRLVVTTRNGRPVYLGDLGNVLDAVEDLRTFSMSYTKESATPGINLMVMKQPGSNVISVNDQIRALIPTLRAQLPPAVVLSIRGDRSKNIRESFEDMKFTMTITLGLVIGVIFIFLRNASATVIPTMALPFSILGTLAVMYLLDYSLDNLSMMALILSICFVVDDAIVMLENIVRHMDRGESAMQAAVTGSREIWFTIVSMTLSLAAVFIPILFMGGILGRLFREFAVTIAVAVLISGFVSVTLTPMLCSRLLKPASTRKQGMFFRSTERVFDATLALYGATLRWVLRHRPVMGVVFIGVIAATVYLYEKVPKGFIPDADGDSIYINTEMAQGTSSAEMARLQKQVSDIIIQDPNFESFMTSAGGSSMYGGSANTGRLYTQLVPRAQRKLTASQVIEQLRPKVSGIPGVRVVMSLPPSIRLGGRPSKSTYDYTLQGPDSRELFVQAARLEKELVKLTTIQDVTTDLQMRNPRINIQIDRDKAAALQLDPLLIESSLYNAYGQNWVSTIYGSTNQFKVLLELLPEFQTHADMINNLQLKSRNGNLIPLSAVTRIKQDAGPQSIAHSGQLPSVTIGFNLKAGYSLGEAVEEVEELAQRVLPDNITTGFSGTAKAFQNSLQNLTILLIVAVMVVYIVLGVLYESYVHPITILSGLPSAGVGALFTLLLFKVELSIYAFVGLVMLIGLVKKNAIMQVDFALQVERTENKSPSEAIYEGCIVRFRPIMMTTMAALLGSVPMAIGFGAGGEARRPLGLTVIGGLIFSQLITLYLTPVVYTYLAAVVLKWKAWKSRWQRTTPPPRPASVKP